MYRRDLGLPLSPRQAEVVRLAGEGLTMRETARRLGISPITVHHHRAIAYRRLGVRNKTQAAVILYRLEQREAA